ncbi:MAG: YkgJ family cysteine cluster protein, partial [Spirochaetales bacterium]
MRPPTTGDRSYGRQRGNGPAQAECFPVDITQILPPSVLRERLGDLTELYRRVDEAVDAFRTAAGLSCPSGCGTCCEGFVPDIFPVEAALVATWLTMSNRDLAFSMAAGGIEPRVRVDGRVGCPLYADNTPFHCTVYEARPLICRMFAFSAVRDKRG